MTSWLAHNTKFTPKIMLLALKLNSAETQKGNHQQARQYQCRSILTIPVSVWVCCRQGSKRNWKKQLGSKCLFVAQKGIQLRERRTNTATIAAPCSATLCQDVHAVPLSFRTFNPPYTSHVLNKTHNAQQGVYSQELMDDVEAIHPWQRMDFGHYPDYTMVTIK